jgi:hypothetical protein
MSGLCFFTLCHVIFLLRFYKDSSDYPLACFAALVVSLAPLSDASAASLLKYPSQKPFDRVV